MRTFLAQGFTLLEVMLSVAILGLLVTGFAGAWVYGQDALVTSGSRYRALLLAEEGLEAVRNIKDQSFANLVPGTYGLATTSNQWNFSGLQDTSGGFTRSVQIGSPDANRRIATATVTWRQNSLRTGVVVLTTAFTNYLRAGWNLLQRTFVLNYTGNTDFIRVHTQGNYVYVLRSTGTDLLIFDVSNPDVPVFVGEANTAGSPTDLAVFGDYAYIVGTSNFAELIVVDITNPSAPFAAGTYNDPGNADAVAVAVQGSTAYIAFAGEDHFATVDLSDPFDPQPIAAITLPAVPVDIAVSGNYVYVASSNNAGEIASISVANPVIPTLVSNLNLAGNADMQSIDAVGSRIVGGRVGSEFVVASSSPVGVLTLVSTLPYGATINDIDLISSGTLAFGATALAANEFAVFSLSDPAAPTVYAQFNNTGTTNGALSGVAYRASPERVYAVSAVDAAELFVYAPQ